MRRVLIAALVTAATALPSAVAAETALTPKLRLEGVDPLVVRGTHFKPRERVRVVVTAGTRRLVRRTTATAAGAFTLSFGAVATSRCEGVSAYAVGARGSTAEVKHKPLPECAPEGAP